MTTGHVHRGIEAKPEFHDFMSPDIDWVTPAEYAAAFDGMCDLEQLRFERECARELSGELDE